MRIVSQKVDIVLAAGNRCQKPFTMSTPKQANDDSPCEDEGEIDHIGRDAAVKDLLMPERVKKLQSQVDIVLFELKKIFESLAKLEKMNVNLSK
jgi:hypothetical protein